MSQPKPQGNISAGYVDISSFDKPEGWFYGGEEVVSLFTHNIKHYSWFTQLFANDKGSGNNDSPVFPFSKTGDFAVMSWVETTLPRIRVNPANNGEATWRIALTWNPAHNIWRSGALKFNDLTIQSYDSVMLDVLNQYRRDNNKWALYQQFIGNTKALQDFSSVLPSTVIKMPTPFYYSRDTGISLALCCASLNEGKEEFQVETNLRNLIRVEKNVAADVLSDPPQWVPQKAASVDFDKILIVDGGKGFELGETRHWTKYVMVTDLEREFHESETRDVIIEQFQKHTGTKGGVGEHRAEFHFSMPVGALFFGFANKTSDAYNNRSNYTDSYKTVGVSPADPLLWASLSYESQSRFTDCPGHHFDMETWQHGARAITEKGYHGIFYKNHINDLDQPGSSNFSNLMTTLAAEAGEQSGENNEYALVIRALSAHRLRFKGNGCGFPKFDELTAVVPV